MALKDWKKIRSSSKVKVWKHKKTNKEIYMDEENNDNMWLIGVNNKNIASFIFKKEALKYVRAYMRKH